MASKDLLNYIGSIKEYIAKKGLEETVVEACLYAEAQAFGEGEIDLGKEMGKMAKNNAWVLAQRLREKTLWELDQEMAHLGYNSHGRKLKPDSLVLKYWEAVRLESPYLVDSFFQYIERDTERAKRFYAPRREKLMPIIKGYQDIYDGKLDFLSVSQPKRTGKMQPLYSKVLTPNGYKNMGDIKVGSKVISCNGDVANVLEVYPHKQKDVYEFVLGDGRRAESGLEHLWKAKIQAFACWYEGIYETRQLMELFHNGIDVYIPTLNAGYQKIEEINYRGVTDCQCIMIDHESHLYVTDDCILTHNTTSGLRLSLMMGGRKPDGCIFATGKGEGLVKSFFGGLNETFDNEAMYQRYLEIFPNAIKVGQNAEELTIHLGEKRRFATFTCRPIDGSVVGNTEANVLLYLDDTVKNHEEARNRERLEFLCEKVTDDILGRRIEGTPIIIQGTKYSLYDPISHLQSKADELEWRWREVAIPALDPVTDESNWEIIKDGKKIFTTEYYRRERKMVTPETWAAEFQQEPYEAKGRMFPEDKLNRYEHLPVDREPDTIIAACDSADRGDDSCAMPIAYVYGNDVYIEDVVFDNSGAEHTKPECANMIIKHNVKLVTFESNAAGTYFGQDVMALVDQKGGRCSARYKYNTSNKITRMENACDNIIKYYYFKDAKCYERNSPYWRFMRELTTMTRAGKVKHDDAPDSLALLENEMRNAPAKVEAMTNPFRKRYW